jgi:hypothetical protein
MAWNFSEHLGDGRPSWCFSPIRQCDLRLWEQWYDLQIFKWRRYMVEAGCSDNTKYKCNYGLPNGLHVTLSVFSTLGRQVAVLQNGEQEAGYHEVQFDGKNLSSGVYFYRLRAGDFVETKRLLLLR